MHVSKSPVRRHLPILLVNGVTTSVKKRQRGLGSIRDHKELPRLSKWYCRRHFQSRSVARRFLRTLRHQLCSIINRTGTIRWPMRS